MTRPATRAKGNCIIGSFTPDSSSKVQTKSIRQPTVQPTAWSRIVHGMGRQYSVTCVSILLPFVEAECSLLHDI